MKLNLGCGTEKLEGYINIDVEPTCKPDLIFNFLAPPLPYEAGSVESIVMFHTIEHVRKTYHLRLLQECYRLLEPKGQLIISFPEFLRCVENWKSNKYGIRDKWEQTIFGRQLYPSDYHVSLMDSSEFTHTLDTIGFVDIKAQPEAKEDFNTIVYARRGPHTLYTQEEVVKQDMERFTFQK